MYCVPRTTALEIANKGLRGFVRLGVFDSIGQKRGNWQLVFGNWRRRGKASYSARGGSPTVISSGVLTWVRKMADVPSGRYS